MESGEILPDSGVSGFDGRGVLFGGPMLGGGQHFGVYGIIVGQENRPFIPGDARHQLAQRFGGTIANS